MNKRKINEVILWRDLLDLGFSAAWKRLRKKKSYRQAIRELKNSLFRASQEHWRGLYIALKKIKC